MTLAAALLVSAITSAAVAAVNGVVALRLLERTKKLADPASLFAVRCFALWWGLTAINQTFGAALYAAASLGFTDVDLQLTYTVLQRLLLAGSLFGLLYYLVFVTSGKRALVPLAVAYALLAVLELYDVFVRAPDHVIISRWRTDIGGPLDVPSWLRISNAALLILPPVVASLWYLRLARHIDDRSRRARIFAISLGLTVWWIVAVIAGGQQTFDNDALQIANRVIQASVAMVILFAFQPTPWMRRRFHIEPFAGAA